VCLAHALVDLLVGLVAIPRPGTRALWFETHEAPVPVRCSLVVLLLARQEIRHARHGLAGNGRRTGERFQVELDGEAPYGPGGEGARNSST
jgi:hypothetical protein